jgi:hypothetical protein
MSPAFWESKATRLYPYRWWLGGTSILAFIAMGASGLLGERAYVMASVAVGLPLMVAAWGLLCATSWFEPSKGTLSSNSWLGRHMPPLNAVARWWAALFLSLFFAAAVLAPIWWLFNVA